MTAPGEAAKTVTASAGNAKREAAKSASDKYNEEEDAAMAAKFLSQGIDPKELLIDIFDLEAKEPMAKKLQ